MARKRNEVIRQLAITDYAAEGRSIGRTDGKVVFVEQTVPGDVVDVRLTRNKKDWAEGIPLSFHSYSAERVQPFCSHFGVCGGCQWQMLPYERQLQFKQQQVIDNLERIARVPLPPIRPIIGATSGIRYRNKMEYTFATRKYLTAEELRDPAVLADVPVAGFHAKGMYDKVVDVDTCYLQAEPSNRIRKLIRDWAIAEGKSFYNIRLHEGWLRTVQIRLCETGELMVNVVFGHEQERDRDRLLSYLMQECPDITTLLWTINSKQNDSLYDLDPQVYHGPGFVIEMLQEFRFKIGPKSFFQTNTKQAEQLYRVTREFAELTGREVLYDLYCGTGSIGIFCSKGSRQIIGVESVPEAIEDARINAELNGIRHASFYAGDVIRVCDADFFASHGRPDVIITDPPRAGMHDKLVQMILQTEAPRVVYVSCNPATQARDLQGLHEKYEVTAVQPVDMFPQTHHIENIVQLKLKP